MAGLVGYDSSDEDDDIQPSSVQPKPTTNLEPEKPQPPIGAEAPPSQPDSDAAPLVGPARPTDDDDAQVGPSLPPMEEVFAQDDSDPGQPPQSPYSRERAIIHDLTLPSVPNLDIPPSPPGSPTPSTNKKFEQFLELKKKGIHFNSKLESSAALRNPSLTDKLMGFVEIDEREQYQTTLPADLWDPNGFPEWAFRDRLRKSRDKVVKEKEADKASGNRSGIDFVASTTAAASATSTVGGIGRGTEKRSKGGWN